ncbi:MAG: DUF58 domain-containing protein [Rhodobiaceae bacterium]|nr:DUF58 domain-containing protein [Rhodobiaceae bacterium]
MAHEAAQERGKGAGWHQEAAVAAAALPALLVEASAIAHSVAPGWHGRRRAGSGETFWQYRRFAQGDLLTRIDWRRSARDDHLYIREQEWEAAHTVWLWPDRSPSMGFASDLASRSKDHDAIVMALALGEILVRGGERIAVPGLTRPAGGLTAPRRLAEEIARAITAGPAGPGSGKGGGRGGGIGARAEYALPPLHPLSAHSDYVLFSDFLQPLEALTASIQAIAALGLRCHLVQILDPVEETFPFAGRVEFLSPNGQTRLLAGRAEMLKERYVRRLQAHREALRDLARRIGGSFTLHHTDRPPHLSLLALHAILSAPRDAAPALARRSPAGDADTVPALELVGGSGAE